MEIKDLLLKENNLSIAEQIVKVIPYCKAELEYKFWKTLHSRYIKKIENLGVEYINYGFFINEKDDMQEILKARKKKNGDIYFEYKLGNINGNSLDLCVGNSGYDERIYIVLALSTEENYIPFKEYDKRLLRIIEELGFNKSSEFKYLYFNYDLNFHTESIFKLQDEATLDLAVNSIGDETLDIMNRIINNKDLIELGVEMNKQNKGGYYV